MQKTRTNTLMHFVTDASCGLGIFFLMHVLLKTKWNFDFISVQDWQALGSAWETGQFVINNGDAFLFILVLFVVPWFIFPCLWLLHKIDWSAMMGYSNAPGQMKIKPKTEEEIQKEFDETPRLALSDIRPNAVGNLPEEVGEIDEETARTIKAKAEEAKAEDAISESNDSEQSDSTKNASDATQPQNPEPKTISTKEQQESQKPAPELIHEDIAKRLETKGYRVLKDVALDENIIDFLAVSNDRVVLIGIDEEEGDWVAEENKMDGESYPEWMGPTTRESPIFMVMQSYATLVHRLEKVFPKEKVIHMNVVLVLSEANVVNIEDIRSLWIELGVSVVRHKYSTPQVPEMLDLFADVLPRAKGAKVSDELLQQIQNAIDSE